MGRHHCCPLVTAAVTIERARLPGRQNGVVAGEDAGPGTRGSPPARTSARTSCTAPWSALLSTASAGRRTTSQKPIIKVIQGQSQPLTQVYGSSFHLTTEVSLAPRIAAGISATRRIPLAGNY